MQSPKYTWKMWQSVRYVGGCEQFQMLFGIWDQLYVTFDRIPPSNSMDASIGYRNSLENGNWVDSTCHRIQTTDYSSSSSSVTTQISVELLRAASLPYTSSHLILVPFLLLLLLLHFLLSFSPSYRSPPAPSISLFLPPLLLVILVWCDTRHVTMIAKGVRISSRGLF
jgi:hypothetical protein